MKITTFLKISIEYIHGARKVCSTKTVNVVCAATGAPSPLCFSESKPVSETPSIEYNSRRSNVSCPIIIPCRGNYASNYVCIFSRYKILRISKRNEEQSESREITLIKIHVRLYWIESNFYEYAQQEKKRKQNDTFGAPRRERCSSAWKVVEDSSRIAVPTRGMKIDQRSGRREDRDDASISKVVEWFRAFLPLLPPFSLSSLPLSLSLVPIESTSGAISIWIIRNFLYLIPSYIHTYIYIYACLDRISISKKRFARTFPDFWPVRSFSSLAGKWPPYRGGVERFVRGEIATRRWRRLLRMDGWQRANAQPVDPCIQWIFIFFEANHRVWRRIFKYFVEWKFI